MATIHATRVIGIRVRAANPLSYYDPSDLEVCPGDSVVVDTPLGPEIGKVALAPGAVIHRDEMLPVRPALRIASFEDHARHDELKVREAEALVLAKAKALNLRLPMKFSSVRVALDGRKVVLEFTADQRIEGLPDLLRRLPETLGIWAASSSAVPSGSTSSSPSPSAWRRSRRCRSALTASPASADA